MKGLSGGPALVVASIALFVSLTSGAVAAGVVSFAKHAATADTAMNAKKLAGETPAQLQTTMRGARGAQGTAGAAGPPGAKGDTGPMGTKGEHGPTGPKGEQGPTGAKGPPGPTGSTGPAGLTGATGPAGPKGLTGPQGVQGVQGAKGDQGPKGDVGAGLRIVGTVAAVGNLPASGTLGDAYLVGGDLYVWTGSAWTNAGPVQGPKGATGAQGIQGLQGLKGDPGVQGPAGPAGPQGPQGPSALVTVHTQQFSLAANGMSGDANLVTAGCAVGQKAIGGGFDSNGDVFNEDTLPTATDDGWQVFVVNGGTAAADGNVYAICLG